MNREEAQQSASVASIRQALYHLSRGSPLPANNSLLRSPLVSQYVQDKKLSDTNEERAAALHEILKQLLDDFAHEEPSDRRHLEVQRRIFDMLFELLRGQHGLQDVPSRSYERYHAEGIRMLAAKFRQREERLRRAIEGEDALQLNNAQQQAETSMHWLELHPGTVDVFVAEDLLVAAGVIADYDYYEEARPYFKALHVRLDIAPSNRIMLRYLVRTLRYLAHSHMNLGIISQAIADFTNLSQAAAILGDWEAHIHGMHMLGVVYDLAEQQDKAMVSFKTALAHARKGPEEELRIAWIQRDIVHALTKRGRWGGIDEMARASLAVREKRNDVPGYIMTLESWGRALAKQERYTEATIYLDRALGLAADLRSALFRSILLTTMADLQWQARRNAAALDFARQAQALASQHHLWRQHENAGRILRALGTA